MCHHLRMDNIEYYRRGSHGLCRIVLLKDQGNVWFFVGSVRPELTFSTFSSRDDNAREQFELLPGISLFRWFERGQNRQSTLV